MTEIPDSYVTSDEILDTYLRGDPRSAAIALRSADIQTKTWYLQRATKIIDNLPFKGTTYYEFTTSKNPGPGQQNRQFPRWIDGKCYVWLPGATAPEVPHDVIEACCEEAVALYDLHSKPDKVERLDLQRQGVVSINYQGTYETYAQNPSGSISRAGQRFRGLMSEEAYDLLKWYLLGAGELRFG